MPLAADQFRREVLVRGRVFKDRGDMDAALVRECEFPGDRLILRECNPGILFYFP